MAHGETSEVRCRARSTFLCRTGALNPASFTLVISEAHREGETHAMFEPWRNTDPVRGVPGSTPPLAGRNQRPARRARQGAEHPALGGRLAGAVVAMKETRFVIAPGYRAAERPDGGTD